MTRGSAELFRKLEELGFWIKGEADTMKREKTKKRPQGVPGQPVPPALSSVPRPL
jgi:hypothetical protein